MSEFRVTLRPALAGRPPIARSGVYIEALPEGTVLHLLANTSFTTMPALDTEAKAAGLSLRTLSPGQWFAVGTTPFPFAELNELKAILKPKADIVDQSHGRVRTAIRGHMATRVLAKGSAVDFALAEFAVGQSTTTLIGHIAVHLTRTEEEAFELIVLRGFAESLWDDLAQMSVEFS
ncbi:sarcosine oxidase subunit gamma family protein (plasmid) [Rhizobium sp. CB3090]|uniref:sarcosine oxidase subunit gamma family protein n=1 Tax=Rhizobium sp. CB3090 TaxID=3039156 RepID=UPI0024B0FF60|nr:sarcosine oxidase subunit gamma family protein [Rhizobium sp. CB3090]WFU11828.1 sarcosine oxidase subunit gamma family protein [Rhizobium sp. CB3090]